MCWLKSAAMLVAGIFPQLARILRMGNAPSERLGRSDEHFPKALFSEKVVDSTTFIVIDVRCHSCLLLVDFAAHTTLLRCEEVDLQLMGNDGHAGASSGR